MRSLAFSPVAPRTALIALNAVSGITPRMAYKVSQQEGLFDRLQGMSLPEASACMAVSEKAVINFIALLSSDFGVKEEAKARDSGSRIVTIMDEHYPERLREIADPPIVLYIKGSIPSEDDAVIAIVGSREATEYGIVVAEKFSMRLAEAGAAVISGMARGIDTAAHRGAIKAGGRTFGVLGCGLDVVYPAQNKDLFDRAIVRGGLISEFPFGTEPLPYNFPRRNRLVSALSQGVVVVEANTRSGALITAEFALEQGREVFAVPGRIDSPQSRGPHELIRHGAKIVLSVEDIFESIPGMERQPELFFAQRPKKLANLTADEARVMSIIEEGTISFDALAFRSLLPVPALMGVCLSLQLRRVIRELPGKIYESL